MIRKLRMNPVPLNKIWTRRSLGETKWRRRLIQLRYHSRRPRISNDEEEDDNLRMILR